MYCRCNFRVGVTRLGRLCLLRLSAYRQMYAVRSTSFNPFVVTGSSTLYDGINAHGELDLYDPATGLGELTDQYLKDPAKMLSWKMKYDVGAEDADDEALWKEAA